MIVSAHQPHYLPWIGYFNKIHLSDVFLCMDNMEFTNKGYINRNRIISRSIVQYLSVPLIKPNGIHTLINELIIENESQANWRIKHLKTLEHNYSKGKGFNSFFPILVNVFNEDEPNFFNFQLNLIKAIMNYLNITTKIQLGSEKKTSGKKESELIINILESSGCNSFLFGLGASNNYVNKEVLIEKGFGLVYQNFTHPIYNQKYRNNFIPGLSIVDCLLNSTQDEAEFFVKESGKLRYED